MPISQSYSAVAQAYVESTRALLATPATATAERGTRAGAASGTLADRDTQLAPLSATLTEVAAAQLDSPDPSARQIASTQLLAKALTDLEIGRYLLAAAEEDEGREKPEATRSAAMPTERGILPPGTTTDEVEECLRLIVGPPTAAAAAMERAITRPPESVAEARKELATTAGDALEAIRDQAARVGQDAIGGMLVLGLDQIAKAAGIAGMDIASALGQAEKATQIYNLFRTFALNAYNSLAALLGPMVVQVAAKQTLAWANNVAKGKEFGKVLDKYYQTGPTSKQIALLVNSSPAALEKYRAAIQEVDSLNGQYRQQIGLVDKILRGLTLFGAVPIAVMPQARLLLAAAYLVIGAYVVLAGADYVDARSIKLLDRVPGIRQVVEKRLGTA
jgi:hypothetical protein